MPCHAARQVAVCAAALAASALPAVPVCATEPPRRPPETRLHLESSPVFPLMKGFSFEAALTLPAHTRVALSAFTIAIPEAFHGPNRGMGWTVRDTGLAATVQWSWGPAGRGPFAGFVGVVQERTFRRAGGAVDVIEVGGGAELGYRYFPFEAPVYVAAAFLFIYPLHHDVEPRVDGVLFEQDLANIVPSLTIGWEDPL